MDQEFIIRQRLARQHLLTPADSQQVIKDLCGVQSQFLSHALHTLFIRSTDADTSHLLKSWTIRGTMHLFSREDLPLFLHEGRTHFLRSVDTMETDAYLDSGRKAYFAQRILEAIELGTDSREDLKILCEQAGMTDSEAKSLFDPWGGMIRALCESGKICHKVQEKKAYQLCPDFTPMDANTAQLELVRRYFTHFGPATVKDCAYFLGTTQRNVTKYLPDLNVDETELNGRVYYSIGEVHTDSPIPDCIFLGGFDQLILGYEKAESLQLDKEHLRKIFTLSGIVRPAVLIRGKVAGFWNKKGRRLTVTLFSPADQRIIADAAARLWPELGAIHFE